MIPFTFRLH